MMDYITSIASQTLGLTQSLRPWIPSMFGEASNMNDTLTDTTSSPVSIRPGSSPTKYPLLKNVENIKEKINENPILHKQVRSIAEPNPEMPNHALNVGLSSGTLASSPEQPKTERTPIQQVNNFLDKQPIKKILIKQKSIRLPEVQQTEVTLKPIKKNNQVLDGVLRSSRGYENFKVDKTDDKANSTSPALGTTRASKVVRLVENYQAIIEKDTLETVKNNQPISIELNLNRKLTSEKVKNVVETLLPGELPDSTPDINITIGRVEVRALMTSTAPKVHKDTAPILSLNEYLKQRKEGTI